MCQGYGRGSKRLGVPTANLPHFNDLILEHGLQSKVFFGWGVLLPEGRYLYMTAFFTFITTAVIID